jgi:Flp pilus assembly pilin Flp
MRRMTRMWLQRLRQEDAQTLVEYALIILFISIALVTALGALGDTLSGIINDIATSPPFGS